MKISRVPVSVVGAGNLVADVVQATEVIAVGIIDVGDKMDNHDLFWDEDLTSDLEWTFVAPMPKAPSMSPVIPRAPPKPFVTVQDLQQGKPMPECDHFVPDSLPSSSMIGRDPLPVPDHKSSTPSSLQCENMIVHQSNADSSERPQSDLMCRHLANIPCGTSQTHSVGISAHPT